MFPDDSLLSPRHCSFIYREGKLHVVDEGSTSTGVFIRIKAPVDLVPGARCSSSASSSCRSRPSPPDLGPQPDAEGTYFYASPKRPSKMKLIQRLPGRRDRHDLSFRATTPSRLAARGTTSTSSTIRSSRASMPDRDERRGQITLPPRSPDREERNLRPDHGRADPRPRRLRLPGAAAPAGRNQLRGTPIRSLRPGARISG